MFANIIFIHVTVMALSNRVFLMTGRLVHHFGPDRIISTSIIMSMLSFNLLLKTLLCLFFSFCFQCM